MDKKSVGRARAVLLISIIIFIAMVILRMPFNYEVSKENLQTEKFVVDKIHLVTSSSIGSVNDPYWDKEMPYDSRKVTSAIITDTDGKEHEMVNIMEWKYLSRFISRPVYKGDTITMTKDKNGLVSKKAKVWVPGLNSKEINTKANSLSYTNKEFFNLKSTYENEGFATVELFLLNNNDETYKKEIFIQNKELKENIGEEK